MGQSGKRFRAKAMRAQKVHISLLPLATLVAPILGQLQFNGGVSSSSNNNGNSANRNTNRPTSGDVDEKFFLGGDTPSLTGNQALDGGIVGLGLGALGAAVLGPTIQGALNGAQQSQGYSCGRRKRQANFGGSQTSGGGGGGVQETDVDERFPPSAPQPEGRYVLLQQDKNQVLEVVEISASFEAAKDTAGAKLEMGSIALAATFLCLLF